MAENATTTAGTTTAATERPLLRRLQGIVSAAKANKTIKVAIGFQTKHPKYGKYITRHTVLQVHDEAGDAREGDTVEIAECRPISKTKHHRLVRVVTRAPGAPVKAEEPADMIGGGDEGGGEDAKTGR